MLSRFPDSPETIQLIDAVENVIYEIATDKMTPVEVIGVLEVVKDKFLQPIRESE